MGRRGAPVPPALRASLLLVTTLGAGMIGIAITGNHQATALWWPASGTGLLVLMTAPRLWWPRLLPLLMLTYLTANLLSGRPLDAALCLGLSDTAETILVAMGLRARLGRHLRSVTDVSWLVAVASLGALVAALGVAGTSTAFLGGSFGHTLLSTLSSHAASLILLAPLGMAPRPQRPRIRSPHPLGSPFLLGAQVALLAIATIFAFGREPGVTLAFAPLPLMIWAAVSFGYWVVVVEQVGVSLIATGLTLLGHGPFAEHNDAVGPAAPFLQLYLISLVLSGLPLALAVREQRTAIARAEMEKRRTEAVIESSNTPILVADETGRLVSVNPATSLLTGFAAAELLGRPFWEKLLPPETWAQVKARFTDITAIPPRGEGVISTAAGDERMVTFSTGILRNPEDESHHLVITVTDITGERATSRLLQHLLRSETTVAIVGTDRTGRITLLNAGAEAMLRVDAAQTTLRDFVDFLDPGEVAERGREYGALTGFEALVHAVEADGSSRTGDWTWVPPDGVSLRVSMTTSLISDGANRPIGYLFVARDVTETRRNQEILREALAREETAVDHLRALDEAKDDFVSTVSHELRTPLSSIIGSTELLADEMVGEMGPQQRQLLSIIERNAERLLALANDLLLLAAHKSANVATQFAPVDLRAVARASHATVLPLLAHRDLTLEQALPADPVPVIGDIGYLERAVTNLLTNAIKFTPDGGTVRTGVRIDPGANTCSLTVSDTGIGIPAEELRDVFVRFFRSSNVRADAIQGTGLGLAIVRNIVESHHGRIEVASEPGEGTTFTITLPRGPGEDAAWVRPD